MLLIRDCVETEAVMDSLPVPPKLEELRHRLRLIRIYVSRLHSPALDDLDSLLSVAESEVERALSEARRQQTGHG
jgi:hypothetical protein